MDTTCTLCEGEGVSEQLEADANGDESLVSCECPNCGGTGLEDAE